MSHRRLSDEDGKLKLTQVLRGRISRRGLEPSDVNFIDTSDGLYVFIGPSASQRERKSAWQEAEVSGNIGNAGLLSKDALAFIVKENFKYPLLSAHLQVLKNCRKVNKFEFILFNLCHFETAVTFSKH